MSLRDVLAYVQQQQQTGACVTPVTPENSMGLQPKPAWIGACTPATSVTPHFGDTQANTPKPAPELTDCTPAPAAQPAAPAPDVENWRVLASAYHAHHFKCPVCIAAGRGVRYGLPCGVGAALWVAYDEAARASPMPWDKPKKGQRHD